MRTAAMQYSRAETGDFDLYIERPNFGELSRGSSWQDAQTVESVGQAAWSEAEWVIDLARTNNVTVDTLVDQVFDPDSHQLVTDQIDKIDATDRGGRHVVYWLASVIRDPLRWPPSARRQGFAKVNMDSRFDSRLLRFGQLLGEPFVHTGLYVSLHDLNVVPEEQGKGIGTALAYVALTDQPKELPSSLYTATNNEPMRAWAEKYGYKVTDEYEDTKMFNGVSVPMVRYEASRVGSVLHKMREANPWLTKGTKKTMLGLVLDQGEAEIISRYTR